MCAAAIRRRDVAERTLDGRAHLQNQRWSVRAWTSKCKRRIRLGGRRRDRLQFSRRAAQPECAILEVPVVRGGARVRGRERRRGGGCSGAAAFALRIRLLSVSRISARRRTPVACQRGTGGGARRSGGARTRVLPVVLQRRGTHGQGEQARGQARAGGGGEAAAAAARIPHRGSGLRRDRRKGEQPFGGAGGIWGRAQVIAWCSE